MVEDSAPKPSERSVLFGKLRLVARRIVSRVWDPDLKYEHHGFMLDLPLSHELPSYRLRHPLYGTAIGRIAEAMMDMYPDGTIVDIGANVGDTAATIRRRVRAPILCVEGDETFYRLLSRNAATIGDVEVAQAILDWDTGQVAGSLVKSRGTAHMTRRSRSRTLGVRSLPDLLSAHPRFLSPKLVKVDTDGMDARILRGSGSVLQRSHPLVFFEYDPYLAAGAGADLQELVRWLLTLGYQHGLAYKNTGEFLQALDLENERSMIEFHLLLTGHRGRVYADVCLFHHDDDQLRHRVSSLEPTSSYAA